MATRKLTVAIVGDSRSLERAFGRSAKSAKTFNSQLVGQAGRTRSAFAGIASAAGLTFGAAGIIGGIKRAVDASSSLSEQMSKSQVVFGKSALAILAWSRTTADAFGIASSDSLAAASNFALLFRTMGKGQGQTAAMSKDFVELAGDLASFFDVSTDTALDKLRSGLSGEAEPLRQFGIFVDEAKVKAEAYRSGIAKAGATLTQGQKIQARYNLIIREAGPAHGDAARTADSWANVQRRLSAQLEDTAAKIGTLLIPKLQELGGQLSDWLAKTENQERLARAVSSAIGGIATAAATVGAVVGAVTDTLGGWRNALTVAVGAWVGFRAAAIGSAVAIMTANLVAAGATARAWQAALISTGWGALAVAAGIAAAFVVTHWEKVKVFFKEFWKWLELTANKAALKVVEVFSHIPNKGGQWARDLKEQIKWNMAQIEAEAAALAGEGGKKAGESFADRFERELREALKRLDALQTKPSGAPTITTPGAGGLTGNERAARRNQWFDADVQRRLNRLQDLGLRKQLAGLRAVAATLRARLAITKDRTRQLTLADQILEIEREQRSVQEQIGESVRKTNEALRERHENRLFRELGLGPGGAALVPGVDALRRRLGRTQDALKGTALDTDKMKKRLAAMRKVLSDPFTKGAADVRSAIERMLADIDRKLDERKGRRQHFRAASTDQMLAGLGLTPEQMRIARGRIAGVAGGKVPLGGPTAFGMRLGAGVTVVNVNGNVVTPDPDQFIRKMQRRAKRTRAQQRGVRPGVSQGLA